MRGKGLFIFVNLHSASSGAVSDRVRDNNSKLNRYCEIVDYWHDWIFDKELKDRALQRGIT